MFVLILAPCALIVLMFAMYGLTHGWVQRYLGIIPMLFGVLLLAIITMASIDPNGPGIGIFSLGVAGAVCLGWWGYKIQRRRPLNSTGDMFLESMAMPTPSIQAIRPEVVQGSWRFYVDAAASTVIIDLQADGRYKQVIVGNNSERIDCPGGTWTLDGAYLDLTSYHSAVRSVTEHVRWFFGDWHEGLILLAKDDSQSETMLHGRKIKG